MRGDHFTTERENNRIETAVSAAANSATTARLSHASTVTLPDPQMSCSPRDHRRARAESWR
jgi:hypothetical protein